MRQSRAIRLALVLGVCMGTLRASSTTWAWMSWLWCTRTPLRWHSRAYTWFSRSRKFSWKPLLGSRFISSSLACITILEACASWRYNSWETATASACSRSSKVTALASGRSRSPKMMRSSRSPCSMSRAGYWKTVWVSCYCDTKTRWDYQRNCEPDMHDRWTIVKLRWFCECAQPMRDDVTW